MTEAAESVVAVHSDDNRGNVMAESERQDVPNSDSPQPSLSAPSDMQRSSSLFLLGLKEKHKLTQVAVQSIIDSVTTLTQQKLSSSDVQQKF